MRKILIALAAAATLAGAVASTTAPAEAKVHVFLGFGSPGYYNPYYDPYYDPGFYPDPYYVGYHHHHRRHHPVVKCRWVKAWHHHHWVTYKQCHKVWY